jgi:hypothetical protein
MISSSWLSAELPPHTTATSSRQSYVIDGSSKFEQCKEADYDAMARESTNRVRDQLRENWTIDLKKSEIYRDTLSESDGVVAKALGNADNMSKST